MDRVPELQLTPVEERHARELAEKFPKFIAFLIPGFLSLWGLSRYVGDVRQWLGTASSASTSVGGFLFVVLASLGLGVFVSGVRYFLFDKFLLRWGVPKQVSDEEEAARTDALTQAVYEDLRDQFYRYYQFYANTAVALVFALVLWWFGGGLAALPGSKRAAVLSGAVVALVFLYFSARDSITKFRNKKATLLSRSQQERSDDERRRGSRTPKTGSEGAATTEAAAQTTSAEAPTKARPVVNPERQ